MKPKLSVSQLYRFFPIKKTEADNNSWSNILLFNIHMHQDAPFIYENANFSLHDGRKSHMFLSTRSELTALKSIKQYRYTFRFNEFQNYDFRCHVCNSYLASASSVVFYINYVFSFQRQASDGSQVNIHVSCRVIQQMTKKEQNYWTFKHFQRDEQCRVGQIKRGQLTFLFVTIECIYKIYFFCIRNLHKSTSGMKPILSQLKSKTLEVATCINTSDPGW